MDHLNSLELCEYITRSLNKIRHKKYESYVINRIVHQLNDFTLKFITQQYVKRSDNKIALTDLYFPQLGMHVEIDEGHHFEKTDSSTQKFEYVDDLTNSNPHYVIMQTYEDKFREEDIISITGHEILRINVYKNENGEAQSLQSINEQISNLLKIIKDKKNKLVEGKKFTPWNIMAEFKSETYRDLGEIKLKDNVIFKKIVDACNCFGLAYEGYQRGGAKHPIEPNTLIWFPKLYKNDEWDNFLSADGITMIEKSVNPSIMPLKVEEWNNGLKKRIVFAKVKHPLYRKDMYRFLGLYEMQGKATIENGGIWKRIATSVKTYSSK